MKLKNDLEAVIAEMEATARTVTPDEKKVHQDMLTKTNENILKEQEELEERKRRKLEFLEHPRARQPRDRRSKNNYSYNPNQRANHPYNRFPRQYRGQPRRGNNQRPRPQHLAQRGAPPPAQQANIPAHTQPQSYMQVQATGHAPQPNVAELTNLFSNWLRQNGPHVPQQPPTLVPRPPCAMEMQQPRPPQQPPTLVPKPPCAVGMQQPTLHNPAVNPPYGQPPMLFNGGQQVFP